MAKAKQSRRLADNETRAFLKSCKSSAQKARLVLDMIRGQKVEKALADLTFSKKSVSVEIKKLLESAIANAENNHDLNVDNLVVKAAYADKSFQMKRWRCRARGRMAKILKPRSHLTIIVAEAVKVEPKQSKDAA